MNHQFADRRKRNIPLEEVAKERIWNIVFGIGLGIMISGVFALILYNM